jgi:hypothetical protein
MMGRTDDRCANCIDYCSQCTALRAKLAEAEQENERLRAAMKNQNIALCPCPRCFQCTHVDPSRCINGQADATAESEES